MSPDHCQMSGSGRTTPVRTQLQQPLLHQGQCFLWSRSAGRRATAARRSWKGGSSSEGHPPRAQRTACERWEQNLCWEEERKHGKTEVVGASTPREARQSVRQTCSTTVHRGPRRSAMAGAFCSGKDTFKVDCEWENIQPCRPSPHHCLPSCSG